VKKYYSLIGFAFLFVLTGAILWHVTTAHASFNQNDIMDDAVFDNSNSMSASAIDSWLNSFLPNSCISTNNGFSAPQPIGYTPSGGFTYGGNVSAGTVIYDAAHVYGLNPQVILTTLEKESSVVSGDASYGCEYMNTAMGYDCPDSGSCPQNPATESGFSKQVIIATWMLKYHEERSIGNIDWNVQVTNFPNAGDVWNNSDDPASCYSGRMTEGTFAVCPSGSLAYYDGLTTIDGTSVFLGSGATAALYDYTPHFSGNEHFDTIFTNWFGGIYASPFASEQYSQSANPTLNPGQSTTAYIEFQNEGSYAWYDNNSVGSAPSGDTYPVDLGTSNPLNSASPFCAGWPTNSRPDLNFTAVYDANGTTLAGSQNIVEPGQIVKYSFPITVPSNFGAGTFTQYFQPVADGTGNGAFSSNEAFFSITVNPNPALAFVSKSASPTVYPSQSTNVNVVLQNTGNVPLYDNNSLSSAPSGTYATHLATDAPLNRVSSFSSQWPTTSRPDLNFSAVYNSDDSTLASNQDVALPGQYIEFSFPFTAPAGFAAGTYQEAFTPVLEGTGGYFPDEDINFTVTVPSSPVVSYTTSPGTWTMSANQQDTINLGITNSGNASLPSTTNIYSTSGANFQAPSWTSSTIIQTGLTSSLAAGSSTTIPVNIVAPGASSQITPTLDVEFQQSGGTDIPSTTSLAIPTVVEPALYLSSNVTQSAYPTVGYGQNASVSFTYQNVGNQTWYDQSSLASATTRNPHQVDLGTSFPLNRASSFDDGWFSNSRPDLNFTAVYNSNGTTLASNQNEVQPGQIVQFAFMITPSPSLSPGFYQEFFQPVAEGTADGAFNFPWTFVSISVPAAVYSATAYSQSSYPTISPGSSASAYFEYTNTGTVPWYDDTEVSQIPSNLYVVHLATGMPLNRSSQFSSTWPTSSRPALVLSAVYSSNGSTLASNQHIVEPGQIGKYSFTLSAPSNISPGSYREFFQPVADGSATGEFNFPWTSLVVTVP
jgi:hypothetical protein